MLRAAGFPEAFAEPNVRGDMPASISQALDRIFAAHEPFPVIAFDRGYDILRTNEGAIRVFSRFFEDETLLAEARLNLLLALPDVPGSWRQPDFTAPSDPVFMIRLRRGSLDLAFLATITSFSAPQNVTLEEIRIETYFPLDEATAESCEALRRENR